MKSGQVELLCQELEILNRSEPLPFQLDEHVSEEVRLRFRYIDLRREEMRERLLLRHRITRAMRHYLDEAGFVDIETPMLSKATPEGARDYLVPSRTHAGKFFALPQSPQIYKQLLMISGFDRYYQIVRCFRDEDLRADRQPEFTQLDIETSFLDQAHIQELMEGLVRHLFKQVLDVELPNPMPRMSYAEAMRRYGSDKPDLRVPLELVDVADLVKGCDFKVFAGPAADPRGRVTALCVPQGGRLSRKEIDDYTAYVARYGAKGLAYVKVNEIAKGREGLQSPILKFLSDAAVERNSAAHRRGRRRLDFLRRGQRQGGERCLGALRLKVGQDLKLVAAGWRPLWVVDFPMFEWDDEAKRWQAMHHPFTSPANLDYAALAASPGEATAKAYDMVLNGSEIGGGSVRIHYAGTAVGGVRPAGHFAGRGSRQVRILARCAQVRRAAARRHRLWTGSAGDADGRSGQHSRRHRLPEDSDGGGSLDGCAHRGQRGAASGTAHSGARAAEGRVSGYDRPSVKIPEPSSTGARIGLDRDLHRRRRISAAGAAPAARVLAVGDGQPGMGRVRRCRRRGARSSRRPASRRACWSTCSGPRCTRYCRRSARCTRRASRAISNTHSP